MEAENITDNQNVTSDKNELLRHLYRTHHSNDLVKLTLVKKAIEIGITNKQLFDCLDCKIRMEYRIFWYQIGDIRLSINNEQDTIIFELYNFKTTDQLLPKISVKSKDFEKNLKIFVDKFINHFR